MKYCLFIMLIILNNQVLAKDFGLLGQSFEIKEEGFLSMIYRKLDHLDITKENEKMLSSARQSIEEPKAVEGIKKVDKEQSYTFDPTYTLPEDIVLPSGQVLHRAGTKVNPLEHVSLGKKLVFMDGMDKEQIEWFQKMEKQGNFNDQDKLILIRGRPLELGEKFQRSVYFDQEGTLSQKFGIRGVPAVLEQEGNILRITEVIVRE